MSEANKIGRVISIVSLLGIILAAILQDMVLVLGGGLCLGAGIVLWVLGEWDG